MTPPIPFAAPPGGPSEGGPFDHAPHDFEADRASVARSRASLHSDLRAMAARHHLGVIANELEGVAKGVGDAYPVEAWQLGLALHGFLESLGLATAADPLAADVWSDADGGGHG